VAGATETLVSSTTKVERETESCASDAEWSVSYAQKQREKEIVAGSVIGSFMMLVIVGFGVGVFIAWRRKVKAEEVEKIEEWCELREVESGGQVRREERQTP
jgi:hypothetical protein